MVQSLYARSQYLKRRRILESVVIFSSFVVISPLTVLIPQTIYYNHRGNHPAMVKAWYMDNDTNDQRLEHHRNPPEFITLEDLYKKTGVEYFKINVATYTKDGVLDKIKKDRGYTYEDEITCSKQCLPNYEEKIKSFYEEHLHTDEEIRLVLDGSGYFDVRDGEDQWIRIAVSAGDMIIIPSGIYHRFTLDTNNYIHAKRFFIGEPVWQPYNRPADELQARQHYLRKLTQGFAAA